MATYSLTHSYQKAPRPNSWKQAYPSSDCFAAIPKRGERREECEEKGIRKEAQRECWGASSLFRSLTLARSLAPSSDENRAQLAINLHKGPRRRDEGKLCTASFCINSTLNWNWSRHPQVFRTRGNFGSFGAGSISNGSPWCAYSYV